MNPVSASQLARIEAVHSGFLFQHLVAVACILETPNSGASGVAVEVDEDVEWLFPDETIYIQVKFRTTKLKPSDIESTLRRFARIKAEHESGTRSGVARFFIFTNSSPGPGLSDLLQRQEWSGLATLWWPTNENNSHRLPPAWPDIEAAFSWCSARAEAIPFRLVPADSLVLILAGEVLRASSGSSGRNRHLFTAASLPNLLRQIQDRLSRVPIPPDCYYPHSEEPLFASSRIQLISAISGAGKSSWAAYGSLHASTPVVWIDISEVPAEILASVVAREVAATVLTDEAATAAAVAKAYAPGLTGIQSIRSVDDVLFDRGIEVRVVLDNAHLADVETLRYCVEMSRAITWTLLVQPWAGQVEFTARAGGRVETLSGWSLETTARFLADQELTQNPVTIQSVLGITGGLPLFVRSIAALAKDLYAGDIANLCRALDDGMHSVEIAQERVLARTANSLSTDARTAAAVLSLCKIPTPPDVAQDAISRCLADTHGRRAFIAVRELHGRGLLTARHSELISLHDSFRLTAVDELAKLPEECVAASRIVLVDWLRRTASSPASFLAFLELLIPSGRADELIGYAAGGDEVARELGLGDSLRRLLEKAVQLTSISPRVRFAGLDVLATLNCADGSQARVSEIAEQMSKLMNECDNDEDPNVSDQDFRARLLNVRMLACLPNDWQKAQELIVEARSTLADLPKQLQDEWFRVLKYNLSLALNSGGRFREAEIVANGVAQEYYVALKIDPDEAIFWNIPDVEERVLPIPDWRRLLTALASALEVVGEARQALGISPTMSFLEATRFFTAANSIVSAVRVGLLAVAEMVDAGLPRVSMELFDELLLPAIEDPQLADQIVPVRSMYAIALAHSGALSSAREQLARLATLTPVSEHESSGLRQAINIVDGITRGDMQEATMQDMDFRHGWSYADFDEPLTSRNELCECGSGITFKKCHGRPNARCLCNSGKKYKRCCMGATD